MEKKSTILIEGPPESGGFSTTRLARLDSGMNDWVKKKWVNGSVALIARKGKVVFHKAYGYNDLDTKAALDKNGIFRIASQTKAITTVAAMILWEEGKFSIDDPVSKYIPSFAHPTLLENFNSRDTTYTTLPAKRQITIRDSRIHRAWDILASALRKQMRFMLSIPFVVGTLFWKATFFSLFCLGVCNFLYSMYLGPAIAVAHLLVPASMRALTSAILFLVLNLIGLGFGPLVVGTISDLLAPTFGVESLRWAMSSILVVSMFAAILFFAASRKLQVDVNDVLGK